MYRKLLLALALVMFCTSMSASATSATLSAKATISALKSAGPPPNCHKFPLQPRCRP